jgi:hypothetical protein
VQLKLRLYRPGSPPSSVVLDVSSTSDTLLTIDRIHPSPSLDERCPRARPPQALLPVRSFGFALPVFVARSVAAFFCFFAGMATPAPYG